jgi:hypothetical protein
MNKKITFVTNEDDWEGLYIDGELEVEAHRLSVEDVLAVLGIYAEYITCDQDWLFDRGYLPSDLKDVVVSDD